MARPPASVVLCTVGTVAAAGDLLRCAASQLSPTDELVVVLSGARRPGRSALPTAVIGPTAIPSTVVAEATIGLARARNRALWEATTDLLVFLDDDTVPAPGWLESMVAALAPDAVGAVGGTVIVEWPTDRPAWLPEDLTSLYAERLPAGPDHPPFGPCFGVRRSAALGVGGFREDLGHQSPTSPGLHEETELCRRMVRAGWRLAEAPDAVVRHQIAIERVRPGWVLSRAWHGGRFDARRDGRSWATVAARAAKLGGLLMWLSASVFRPSAAVSVLGRIAGHAGYLNEAMRVGRSDRSHPDSRGER